MSNIYASCEKLEGRQISANEVSGIPSGKNMDGRQGMCESSQCSGCPPGERRVEIVYDYRNYLGADATGGQMEPVMKVRPISS